MKTVSRLRFVSKVNMAGFVQSGVMNSISRNGHHVQKKISKPKENCEEIRAGITVVGGRNAVLGRR